MSRGQRRGLCPLSNAELKRAAETAKELGSYASVPRNAVPYETASELRAWLVERGFGPLYGTDEHYGQWQVALRHALRKACALVVQAREKNREDMERYALKELFPGTRHNQWSRWAATERSDRAAFNYLLNNVQAAAHSSGIDMSLCVSSTLRVQPHQSGNDLRRTLGKRFTRRARREPQETVPLSSAAYNTKK